MGHRHHSKLHECMMNLVLVSISHMLNHQNLLYYPVIEWKDDVYDLLHQNHCAHHQEEHGLGFFLLYFQQVVITILLVK